jgi:hypothetical protein
VLERIANAASETYPNRIGVAAEAIPIYVTYSRDFFGCASYSYYTEAGKLLKQLLRYPGKRFCQDGRLQAVVGFGMFKVSNQSSTI